MPDWPQDQLDTLERMWREGASGSKIGNAIGRSKNAVIGKAHRMGLPPRPSPIKNARPKSECKPTARVLPKNKGPGKMAEVKRQPKNVRHPCQYIVKGKGRDAVFCGKPCQEGSSYCPYHHSICYTSSRGLRNFMNMAPATATNCAQQPRPRAANMKGVRRPYQANEQLANSRGRR